MKKKRLLVTVVFLIFTFALAGCMAGTEEEKAKSMESIEDIEEVTEDKVTDTEQSEAAVTEAETSANAKEELEEEKKINYTKFEDLSLAAEQVGFSFRAVEETEDAYFSSFFIKERQDENEEGNKVGDPYPMVTLSYKEKRNKLPAYTITIYPMQGEIETPPDYVSTEEIEGVEVSLRDYVLIMTKPDYELTEEDREFIDSGKGSFSCDGVTEGEVHFYTMYWVENGIYYEFYAGKTYASIEEIREHVKAVITADYQ